MAYPNGHDSYEGSHEGLGQLPRAWTGPGGGGGPTVFLPGARRFGLPGGGLVETSEAAPIPYLPENGKVVAGPQPEPKRRRAPEPVIIAEPGRGPTPQPEPAVISSNGTVPPPVDGIGPVGPGFAIVGGGGASGGGGGGPVTVTVEAPTGAPLEDTERPGFGIVEAAIAAGLAGILAAAWARRDKR